MKQNLTEVLERAFRNEAVILKNYPGNLKAFFPNKSIRSRVKAVLRRATLDGLKLYVKETKPKGTPWYATDRANISAFLVALDFAPEYLEDENGLAYYLLDSRVAEVLRQIKLTL